MKVNPYGSVRTLTLTIGKVIPYPQNLSRLRFELRGIRVAEERASIKNAREYARLNDKQGGRCIDTTQLVTDLSAKQENKGQSTPHILFNQIELVITAKFAR